MRKIMLAAIGLIAAAPALAQTRPQIADNLSDQDDQQPPQPTVPLQSQPTQAGRVSESSVGQVGQRQSREEAAVGIAPRGRIRNRIQNRIQSRIRNRIDRNYDQQANATSPFEAAHDQTPTGPPKR